MRTKLNTIIRVLILIFILSCKDDKDDINADPFFDAIDVKLAAAIEGSERTEMTVFENNTNINFFVKIVNKSNQDIDFGSYYSYSAIYDVEEYLLIYKLSKNDQDNQETWVPLGKAYVPPINCLMINLPLVLSAKGSVGVAGMPWDQNPDNLPLGPGKYYTALSYTFEHKGKSKNYDLKLEFEVK